MNTRRLPSTLFGFKLRTLAIVLVVGVIGMAALALDLMSEGLVYDWLWERTGETEPAQQVLGFGQYLVRWTRQQPETEPFAQLDHNDVNPYGVNTFLEQEVEPEKRERQLKMISDAGFGWIRQQFTWEDIEIHGKGDFMDRRNLDTVGEVSAWDKYDNIVDLAAQYDINIIARLSQPPAWSQPPGTTNAYTPPADYNDFVDYAVAVAGRYQGRIIHYQVWNEPNLYPEWGDQTVSAEDYTQMLCSTYHALKAVDPEIVVITGALGPTVDLSGRNAYDLLYLQRMYQAGVGDCFDVLSVQGYGLWSGPTDERLRQVTINYQRLLWVRDMMVANGDAHKPIWISEAGWNPVPDDPSIADLERYGQVTMEQAAEWAPLAYERALREWPWVGVINYWYFKPADESNVGHSWYYFRLVEPDFAPTPIWESLAAYVRENQPPVL
ncbi:MAG: cellulase family glycosylhydrolase, partial [Chloroflexi bacterium]|nr:cellulase family glycosylhydrolase [Chloroflexota bacterium]